MDKKEHKPMVDANPKLLKYKFEYWEILDIPKVESTVSLPMCYEKVVKLFKNIIEPPELKQVHSLKKSNFFLFIKSLLSDKVYKNIKSYLK